MLVIRLLCNCLLYSGKSVFSVYCNMFNVIEMLVFESLKLVTIDENFVGFNSLSYNSSCECEVHDVQLNK